MHRINSKQPDPKAMEGFLTTGPRRSKLYLSQSSNNNQPMHPRINRLDNFNKPDGFIRRATPKLSNSGSLQPLSLGPRRQFDFNAVNESGRPTEVHHAKRPKKVAKILLRVALIIIVAVALTGGYIFGKAWWNAHKIFKGGGSALAFEQNIDPHKLNGEGDGRVNVLLLGKGGENHAGGDLTDSIMIASLDPINNGVTLLSVPRDLWVNPDGLWAMKINEVYTRAKDKARQTTDDENAIEEAGLNKISEIIEQYLGVHMHYYSIVEFSAFEEVVNIIGGITVNLPEAYYDGTMLVGNKYLSLPAGTQNLDGGMALAYARSRYGNNRGDFDRGQQQQTVLVGIKDKVLSMGTYSNPIKVSQLLDTLGSRVRTNLSIDDMMRFYDFSKKLTSENITHIDLATEGEAVVRTGNVDDKSVVYPIAGVDNYDEVKVYVRNKLKDGYIIKENPSVIVLNGTGQENLAQQKAAELTGYGYNVILVDDSPVAVASNILIDKTDGQKKYTKYYLEQRMATEAVSSFGGVDVSSYLADFIIIVGQ